MENEIVYFDPLYVNINSVVSNKPKTNEGRNKAHLNIYKK